MPFDPELMQETLTNAIWERASGVIATGLGTRMGSLGSIPVSVSKAQVSARSARRFFPLVRGDRLVTAKSAADSSVRLRKTSPQRVGARTIVRRRPTSRFLVDVERLVRLDPPAGRKNREVGRIARTRWGARYSAVKPYFRAIARSRVYIRYM
jgi:hypothetical protein